MSWRSGLLLLVALTACTGTPSTPAEATTCAQLADLAVETVKDARDAAVNSSRDDFQRLQGDAPAIVRDLEESSEATSARFDELECDSQEWAADVGPRLLGLAPGSTGGLVVIEIGLLSFSFGDPVEELGGSLFP